jgi:hypothetical protein
MEGHSRIVTFGSINLIALAVVRKSGHQLLTAKSAILHTGFISPSIIHVVIKMSFGLECALKCDLLSQRLLVYSFIIGL